MQKTLLAILALLGAMIATLLAALVFQGAKTHAGPELTTPYQAVLLSNGQAFFGKLEKADAAFPVLREVYYLQAQVNPETKQTTNILVKRGKEWHAPDAMVLNAAHILLIEPVKPDSQVGKLIEESRRGGANAQN